MKSVGVLLLLSLLFVSCTDKSPDVPEDEAVRNTFGYYKKAVLAGNGAEAFKWVDRTTVGYYERLLSLAKTADSTTVRALEVQDRFMVLKIRHSIPKETALVMTPEALFTYAIENGMLGESELTDLEIGEVTLNGETATGVVIARGQPTRLIFTFHREGELWKIDLTSLFPQAQAGFLRLLTQSGKSEDDFIAQMLEFQSDVKPGPEIWKPLQ